MAKFEKLKGALTKKMNAKVFIIRHGSTDFNKESGHSPDRIRGWIDVPLNDKGREDARNAAKKLKNDKPEIIYTSDLDRAKETADIINEQFHAPMVVTENLRPWGLGIFQGRKTDEILDELNKMVVDEDIVPKDGESFRQFRERYLGAIIKIVKQAVKDNSVIFVVSHFRNLKALDAWKENGFPKSLEVDNSTMIQDSFKPGEVYEIHPDDIKKIISAGN